MNDSTPLIDVITYSKAHCPHPIQGHLAYACDDNFIGRIVSGYHNDAAHLCLMTPSAAEALCKAQQQLNRLQLGCFIFDSYRPLRAVQDFQQWMQAPVTDAREMQRKQIHYPHLEKKQLSTLGYLASGISNHCYGDTVDLALVDLKTHLLLDMGACFDFFDTISHTTATPEMIGHTAYKNRMLLANVMQDAGFAPYEKEFWHYTFHHREIHTPMDIEITHSLFTHSA